LQRKMPRRCSASLLNVRTEATPSYTKPATWHNHTTTTTQHHRIVSPVLSLPLTRDTNKKGGGRQGRSGQFERVLCCAVCVLVKNALSNDEDNVVVQSSAPGFARQDASCEHRVCVWPLSLFSHTRLVCDAISTHISSEAAQKKGKSSSSGNKDVADKDGNRRREGEEGDGEGERATVGKRGGDTGGGCSAAWGAQRGRAVCATCCCRLAVRATVQHAPRAGATEAARDCCHARRV